jgi:hypothetical protein
MCFHRFVRFEASHRSCPLSRPRLQLRAQLAFVRFTDANNGIGAESPRRHSLIGRRTSCFRPVFRDQILLQLLSLGLKAGPLYLMRSRTS